MGHKPFKDAERMEQQAKKPELSKEERSRLEKDLMQAYTREAAYARCAKHMEDLAGIAFVEDKMEPTRSFKETARVFREWEKEQEEEADRFRRMLGIKV